MSSLEGAAFQSYTCIDRAKVRFHVYLFNVKEDIRHISNARQRGAWAHLVSF